MTQTRLAVFSLVVTVAMAGCSKKPASQDARPQQPVPAPTGQMAPSHAPVTGAVPPEEGPPASAGPVSAATPIADVWANRRTLAGKVISVRGKVVKFNGGILGRNWVHIQDGSGKADDKTNDLTITTADETAVGDQVVVTGTVAVDRDFTAGYAYPVMLENARITRKQSGATP